MRVIREETFGPILTVERFATEAEAVALGNDTEYGLAGAVWTADTGRAHRVGGRAAPRHGVDQRLPPLRPRGGVGRDQAVGQRPRAGPDGAGRVPGAQAHLAQHRAGARAVVPTERGHEHEHDRGAPAAAAPDDGLAEFGYTQSLDRSIGKFASFAAGISYISILTGTFQLFYFGFAYRRAGLLVVLADGVRRPDHGGAVLRRAGRRATRWPARSTTGPSGSAARTTAWLAGWMMLTASIVTHLRGGAGLPAHAAADLGRLPAHR